MLNRAYKSNKSRNVLAALSSLWILASPAFGQEFEPGIVDPFQSQLPVSLWNNDDAESSAQVMRTQKPAKIIAINRLRTIIALAQSFPALAPDQSSAINSARLNMLINHGVMDAAEALAQTLNWYPPLVREQVETIALLTTRPERYCSRLLAKQFIEIEPGMMIYCMVRSKKWQEGIDVFGETLDMFEPERRIVLHRFLELDGDNNPILDKAWTDLPNPFDFILDEAFGRPRGTQEMPPSYIYYAKEVGSSPQAELEFTEQLTRFGSLPENVLFASYRNYVGEKSGAAYERSNIARELFAIDALNPPTNLGDLLSKAIGSFSDGGLLTPFATQMAPNFSKIDLEKIDSNSTRNKIMRLAILGSWSKIEWAKYLAKDDFPLVLAFTLRHPNAEIGELLNQKLPTKQSQIIHNVIFEARIFEELTQEELNVDKREKIELEKAAGEELLLALNTLENYFSLDIADSVRAFQVLSQTGQTQFARDIAVSMLFGGETP